MPRYAPMQDSASQWIARIASIEQRMNALAAQQTEYITVGNSKYILDGSGNAQIIMGDMSSAPQGIGTSSTFNVSTGLTGYGLAVLISGTWRSLAGFTYP